MNENQPSTTIEVNLPPTLPTALIEQAMQLLHSAQRIALLAHEHPDGDCLGSALGFAHILRQMGKICVPACADPAPPDFAFLPGLETLQTTLGDENFDLVIALDAGELSRYGALYTNHSDFLEHATILNLDHHVSSPGCGQVNIVIPEAASTTELVTRFQQQTNLPLTKDAATCLLTGLITDTGSFQYTSTTPLTMQVGAVLLAAGATAETIVKPLFRTHPLAEVRLEATITSTIQTALDGRIIWAHATSEMLTAAGATKDMDSGVVGMLRDVAGVQVAAYFKTYDDPSVTRVSLRSDAPYDVATICMRLGGGGHARAAGATIQHPLQEAIPIVVQAIEQEILAH